jgi:hypothetical protein
MWQTDSRWEFLFGFGPAETRIDRQTFSDTVVNDKIWTIEAVEATPTHRTAVGAANELMLLNDQGVSLEY